jgi:ubiquitin-protein ligase
MSNINNISNSDTTVIVTLKKETIQRLLKDVKEIIKNPLEDNGIYYYHNEENMLEGYAMIVGPEDTPYFGGFYFFKFNYPQDYPHSPPTVKYYTNADSIRFNPNLYVCGKVCVSLLNTWNGEQWTSCQTISTVLLTLCTLLNSVPLLNEPGVSGSNPDIVEYNKIIEYKNIDIAIIRMMKKEKGLFLPWFEQFYPHMKSIFMKNHAKILEFLEKKVEENSNPFKAQVRYYNSMLCEINYTSLLEKYKLFYNEISDNENGDGKKC